VIANTADGEDFMAKLARYNPAIPHLLVRMGNADGNDEKEDEDDAQGLFCSETVVDQYARVGILNEEILPGKCALPISLKNDETIFTTAVELSDRAEFFGVRIVPGLVRITDDIPEAIRQRAKADQDGDIDPALWQLCQAAERLKTAMDQLDEDEELSPELQQEALVMFQRMIQMIPAGEQAAMKNQ